MADIDHINIDLDGDGVKERYNLADKDGRARDDALQELITKIWNMLEKKISALNNEFAEKINVLTETVNNLNTEFTNLSAEVTEDINSLSTEISKKLQWKLHQKVTGNTVISFPTDFNEIYVFSEVKENNYIYNTARFYCNKNMLDNVFTNTTDGKYASGVDNFGSDYIYSNKYYYQKNSIKLSDIIRYDSDNYSNFTNLTDSATTYLFYR